MSWGFAHTNFNLTLVALLLTGAGYLGLMLLLGTSSPFLVVRGTSMEPAFHAGDLLVNKAIPPTQIQVGDVIVFGVPADARERLKMPSNAVHRVVGIEGKMGELVFITKGDNSGVDPFQVSPSAVGGVVVKNLGPVARPILFLTDRTVLLYLGLPLLIFISIVLATLWLSPKEKGATPSLGTVAAADTPPVDIERALSGLASAVAEYGVHLQSHTEVVMNLGEASRDLRQSVHQQGEASRDLRQSVQQQNEILSQLEGVVGDLRKHSTPNDKRPSESGIAGIMAAVEQLQSDLRGQAAGNTDGLDDQAGNSGAIQALRTGDAPTKGEIEKSPPKVARAKVRRKRVVAPADPSGAKTQGKDNAKRPKRNVRENGRTREDGTTGNFS